MEVGLSPPDTPACWLYAPSFPTRAHGKTVDPKPNHSIKRIFKEWAPVKEHG